MTTLMITCSFLSPQLIQSWFKNWSWQCKIIPHQLLWSLDTLLKFAHSTSVADLPKLWPSIAAGPRKSERAIIQSAIEYAHSPAAATTVTLIVNKDSDSGQVTLTVSTKASIPFAPSTLALQKAPRINHTSKPITSLPLMAPCNLQISTFFVMSWSPTGLPIFSN